MKEFTLTINEQKVAGADGDTILAVCRKNNIWVPTLCHLEGVTDVGSCRLCVVEIDGERRINPACTYPAREGLVVRTNTERLEKYRRMMLELIITERNHLCPICAASGECELQTLAYHYKLDNTRYPYAWPSLPVDTANPYIAIDHNRCVLCGRCIRVCDEVVGNHTLDFGRRGFRTVICSDLNQSFGESSCISCGACVQACPTGALYSKPGLYRGKKTDCSVFPTVCSQCGIGCGIRVYVRDGNPIRIESADPAGFKGQLCQKGRFYQLYEHHDRQLSPVVRDSNGELREASWSEAINRVIRRLGDTKKRFGPESIAGIASSVNCNESLRDFCTLMKKVVGTTKTDTLDGSAYRTIIQGARRAGIKPDLTHEAPLESILESDCVVLIGTEPLSSHPVAGCYVLRATNNNAHLITLDTRRDPFHYRIPLQLKTNEGQLGTALKAILGYVLTKKPNTDIPDIAIRKQVLLDDACNSAGLSKDAITHAGDILSSATNPVFIYGDGILRNGDSESVSDLLILASLTGGSTNKKRVLSLKPKGNSRGAWQSGLVNSEKNLIDEFSEKTMRAAWIMLSDDYIEEPTFLEHLKKIRFIIVQASYKSPITALADVVLPSPVWSEREGTYTTLDGIVLDSKRVLPIPDLTREESPVIAEVGRQLTAKK